MKRYREKTAIDTPEREAQNRPLHHGLEKGPTLPPT